MAKPGNVWTLWSQYLAARTAAMVLTSFSVRTNLRTARFFGRQMYRFDHRHRDRARTSIARAFPQWDEAHLDRVTRASFEHFVQLAVEVCHTPRLLHLDTWGDHTRIANLAPAMRRLNSRKPAILLTGHLGNWEVLGYLLATLGFQVEALARPIDNPLINDWLLGIREKRGLSILTKFDATDRMLQVLNEGGVLGFIADQNAGDKGLFVPFFDRLASTYKSVGLLAMNQNVPIICGYAHRIPAEDQLGPAFRYELGVVDAIYPDDWADRPDPLYYITARYVRAIETMVRMRPEQYLWMHRRWKSRPRFERLGKPMPRALRENLEHLPWMTQEAMDRVLMQSDCKKVVGNA